ncbi:unnamed protein product [Anisakis simplex]|uniref:G protein-coupled receptor n=1 Tax=Anisakis simplex TaxID=6269 RepID=A0A0M3JSM6_ANISI|nr:unnamed protein product [Anisakis simplex]
MRLCWCITIGELNTFVCGIPLRNRELCALFGLAQLIIAGTSLFQHIYSLRTHGHVFYCHSNISDNSTLGEKVSLLFHFELMKTSKLQYLAYDIIIFDYGLMHRVLGTNECVANYLDGGFMRAVWCIEHTFSLFVLVFALYLCKKPTWLLWPALLMQSSYVLGLAVLTMATAPKILEAFSGQVDTNFGMAFLIYSSGFILNWLFTFVLWHHYWCMERKFAIHTVIAS